MNGVLVLDKPAGFTSFDAVAVMRGLTHERKIGHTGTLDPMATGVLPLLLGCATRANAFLPDTDKEYEAGFRLGIKTDTQDTTGKVIAESDRGATAEEVEAALGAFRGNILQIPPMVSAVSVGGKRLYELARQGIEVERKPRPVTISRLELLTYDESTRSGTLRIACSKGTYIRTLCADLGKALHTYGVMSALRRTRACGFTLDDCITLPRAKDLAAKGRLGECVLPVETLFLNMPFVAVSEAQAKRFSNGGALDLKRTSLRRAVPPEETVLRVKNPKGDFLGLGRVAAGQIRVLRLFRCSE
jgi:tRNA pseudouridine55 synthase